ncbi:MAG: type I pantothenate kinase [Lactobacillales bacterium]|jgi:type I pantothenate kinase|nr:type I pantothenate kinase [Lactobacillales bacterium]
MISRSEWHQFAVQEEAPLSAEELEGIKSLNDAISLQDVQEIYMPLTHLIEVYRQNYKSLSVTKGLFLHSFLQVPPFIIGISGSVAVGKSTIARLLQKLLSRTFKRLKVDLITTDGFLYANAELNQQNLIQRKGFPESYDMVKMLNFLLDIKAGKKEVSSPVYSHESYDIVDGEKITLKRPDILIVEGINVFQLPQNQNIYVSDFFDFAIYVDAAEEMIKTWYLERFEQLLEYAKERSDNFYYDYAHWPRKKAIKEALNVWENVNLVNLQNYILPTRSRANVILHKSVEHVIDKLYLRRY